MDRGAWWATVHGIAKRVGHNLATKQQDISSLQNRRTQLQMQLYEFRLDSWWNLLIRQDGQFLHFSGGSVVKNTPASAGDLGLISGLGRFLGGGNGNTYSGILA